MSPLEAVILREQARIDSFNQGTTKAPTFGTEDYFTLRAANVGLAYLQRIQQTAADNSVAACESIYKHSLGEAKRA